MTKNMRLQKLCNGEKGLLIRGRWLVRERNDECNGYAELLTCKSARDDGRLAGKLRSVFVGESDYIKRHSKIQKYGFCSGASNPRHQASTSPYVVGTVATNQKSPSPDIPARSL